MFARHQCGRITTVSCQRQLVEPDGLANLLGQARGLPEPERNGCTGQLTALGLGRLTQRPTDHQVRQRIGVGHGWFGEHRRREIRRAAAVIGDRFKDDPLQEAAVRMAIGSSLQGVGQTEQAIEHFQRALYLRQSDLGSDDPETLDSMGDLGWAYVEAGNLEEALLLLEETVCPARRMGASA